MHLALFCVYKAGNFKKHLCTVYTYIYDLNFYTEFLTYYFIAMDVDEISPLHFSEWKIDLSRIVFFFLNMSPLNINYSRIAKKIAV
jgi:hypothetical protein